MKKIIIRGVSDYRLDRYLKRVFPFLTQGNIEKFLRKKDILLNSERAKSSDRLKEGDEISYFAGIADSNTQEEVSSGQDSPFSRNTSYAQEKKHFSTNVTSLANKILGEYLLFDCEYFIAIDKPTGLAVQGGSKISLSVADSLEYLNHVAKEKDTTNCTDKKLTSLGLYEYKIVHRLDKDTSGVLIIAKGYDSAAKLTKGFKDRIIKKEYTAIICGAPKNKQGEISGFIGKKKTYNRDENTGQRSEFERVEELLESDKDAKFALTQYEVIQTLTIKEVEITYPSLKGLNLPTVSLIEYKPQTGRMHQLRVHSKLLGCPIVGDIKYDGPKSSRMMLHAKRVIIPRDIFGTNYDIESKCQLKK